MLALWLPGCAVSWKNPAQAESAVKHQVLIINNQQRTTKNKTDVQQ